MVIMYNALINVSTASMALISFHETLFRAQYPLLPPWSFIVPPSAPLGFNCPLHTLYCHCPHCEPCCRPTLLHATLLCSTVSCTPLNFPAIPPLPFILFSSNSLLPPLLDLFPSHLFVSTGSVRFDFLFRYGAQLLSAAEFFKGGRV